MDRLQNDSKLHSKFMQNGIEKTFTMMKTSYNQFKLNTPDDCTHHYLSYFDVENLSLNNSSSNNGILPYSALYDRIISAKIP